MTDPVERESEFDIAHVLCTDIVGYSKLMIDQQTERLRILNDVVRSTDAFKRADAAGKLLRIPTGDGMVLVFFTHPQDPAECAVQIAQELKSFPEIELRMGVHSGPVNRVSDVNERSNVAGAGINMAQRVMDCGDAGHILVSKRVAEDLAHYTRWRPQLHDLGPCEVKHGLVVDILNLFNDAVGNPALPQKLKPTIPAKRSLLRRAANPIAAVVLMLLVFGGAYLLLHRRQAPTQPQLAAIFPGKSVAIAPFKPLVESGRDEVLEAGMADTLINKLSTSREIIVPSLSSVRKYDDQKHDPVTMGRELRVNAVLEGNVQKAGDRIRVTARLIKVADGSSIWAQTFDEKFTDVFAVQDVIAQKVAAALALKLSEEEQQRLTKRYTENTEAYQLYLKGRFHWNKYTEEGFKKSIEFYNQALALDPNYALAYAGLADTYIQLGDLSAAPPRESFPKAKAYAEKALSLDDKLPQSHVAMGTYLLFYEWNWAAAEKELKRGIELNPSYADAYHFYNHYLESQGRLNEAIATIKHGVELDPLSLIINNELGWAYYHAHDYESALKQTQKTLDMDPNFFVSAQQIAQIYEQMNRANDAIALMEKSLGPSKNWSFIVSELGCAYASAGRRTDAEKVIEQLKHRSATEFIDPYLILVIYSQLGDRDQAFAWLERAVAERATFLTWSKVDPKFDALRSDPRFHQFLGRLHLN